jgi:hypothetical protein
MFKGMKTCSPLNNKKYLNFVNCTGKKFSLACLFYLFFFKVAIEINIVVNLGNLHNLDKLPLEKLVKMAYIRHSVCAYIFQVLENVKQMIFLFGQYLIILVKILKELQKILMNVILSFLTKYFSDNSVLFFEGTIENIY